MLSGKIWGSTRILHKTPTLEIHYFEVNPNSYCSTHKHNYKHNAFFVIDGTLTIEVHKNNYDLVDKTVLGPGDFTTISPGEFHRFVSGLQPVSGLEIYYIEPLSDDIVRKDHGGILATISNL